MSDMRNWKVFCALFSFLSGSLWGELLLEEDNQPLDREQSMPILSYAPTLERITPAVVGITTTEIVAVRADADGQSQVEEFLRRFYGLPDDDSEQNAEPDEAPEERRRPGGAGSGVILSRDGYIITNNHVVTNDSGEPVDEVEVLLTDGRTFIAEIVGADSRTDIAVLKIEADALPYATINRSDDLRVGDVVFAIGNPLNVGLTVTHGIISATGRSDLRILGFGGYEDFIQTDASINMGNSGGALVDAHGRLIGINTAILGRSGNVGIGFSIPSNSAKIVIDQLIEFGETKRGWLGVRIQDVTKEIAEVEKLDEPRGALVASVAPNSPSEKAGVKSGDIILEFNGEKIKQMKELPIIVARTEVGKKVKVKIWRNKKEIIKTITLGRLETSEDFKISEKKEELPKETLIENLKIKVRKLSDQDIKTRNLPNQTNGLVITCIEKGSPLTGSIEVNSIILEAQKKKIRNVEDLNQAIKQVLNSNQKTILLVIYNSQNQKRYIGVKLD